METVEIKLLFLGPTCICVYIYAYTLTSYIFRIYILHNTYVCGPSGEPLHLLPFFGRCTIADSHKTNEQIIDLALCWKNHECPKVQGRMGFELRFHNMKHFGNGSVEFWFLDAMVFLYVAT